MRCVFNQGKSFLNIPVQPVIQAQVKESQVVLTRKNDAPQTKAFHGLYRALIQNAMTGLSKGWSKTLVFKGVGYKAQGGGGELGDEFGLFSSYSDGHTKKFKGSGG